MFIQGSAGNGKTTCLLKAGLDRAMSENRVVLISATSHLAMAIKEELKESKDKIEIVVQDGIKRQIREWVGNRDALIELTKAEIIDWLRIVSSSQHNATSSRRKQGEEEALADWLMKGSKFSANSEAYRGVAEQYQLWKRSLRKIDEGDLWQQALLKMKELNAASLPVNSRACEVLIIDEAQLYPAESIFELFLLWFRPSKCILVGMDTKQAIYLGCSKRWDLLEAAKRASHITGWAAIEDSRYLFKCKS